MLAITFSSYGGPEVLELGEQPQPEPGPGQVRVAVRAAAVNAFDTKVRRGLFGPGSVASFPSVPGYDVAGVVDAVGSGVAHFAPGDEVMGGSATGTYAQYALADAASIVAKPAGVAWDVAGGFDSVARTAKRVLDELGVAEGQTVVINGASGAVGQLAVQLARLRAATVIGTASATNQDRVHDLGAQAVVYGDGLVDRVRAIAPNGVDRAFDVAGRGALPDLVELVGGDPSRVITIADPAAADVGVAFSSGQGPSDPTALSTLVDLLAAGQLRLAVQQRFPLAEAAQAQAQSESGHAWGRLVLMPT
jgi:NADPH:quinone reductase-like Zn-dependent oxidoreductase